MGSHETVEVRVKSFLGQLQAEYGILDRIVYKNKNQHRRCSYFQYLLKVRSDLRLLQSAQLEEILNSSFLVINGNRAKQKVQLLESLKRRKCDGGTHNYLERLLGAARLLSQMVEPMVKAAMEISTLLARSFFMSFSVTILALLARLRVLVQQILVDVVSVFNMVSTVSQKAQSVKLSQQGLEVFREYYPTKDQAVSLECVWETDKFVLHERVNEPENKDMDTREDVSLGTSSVQYQCIETLLGDDEFGKVDPNYSLEDTPVNTKEDNKSSLEILATLDDDNKLVEDNNKVEDDSSGVGHTDNNLPFADDLPTISSSCSNPSKLKSGLTNKVAFISVKIPSPSTANKPDLCIKETTNADDKDPFFNLLTFGNRKNDLF